MKKSWHENLSRIIDPFMRVINFPLYIATTKGQPCRALLLSFVLSYIGFLTINLVAGSLRSHYAHVTSL